MLSSLEMISCQRLQKIAPRECGARLERLGKAGPVRRRSVVRAISAPEKTEKKTDNGTFNAATLRKLGDSDLLVSACCLGTMTWGVQNTESDAHAQLSYALKDEGLNFMDTAEIYPVPPSKETQGLTDKYISTWLKAQKRDSVVLATKVAGYGNQYLRANGEPTRITPAQIEESVNNSLARLGVDYIDLLQIHWPDRYVPLFGSGLYDEANERPDDIPFEEQLRGFENVIKAGKVRYIGVSNETSYGVMKLVQTAEAYGLPKIVSIQNSYSLLVRTFDVDLAEVCAKRQCNVGLLAYSPLAGGSLSGKYIKGVTKGSRLTLFPGYMERYNKSLAREAVAEYVKVADKHGLTPAELALAWCNQQWTVTSSIIGATTLDQLKEDIGAFSIQLSEDCLKDIDRVYKRYRDPTNKPIDE